MTDSRFRLSILAFALLSTLTACGGSSSSSSANPEEGGPAPVEPVPPVDPVAPVDPVDPVEPEPVEPGPGGGATPGTGAAADCLNGSLYDATATVSLEYTIIGPLSGTSKSDYTITPSAIFEGQASSKAQGTVTTTYTGQAPIVTNVQNFFQMDGLAVNDLGNITETSSLGSVYTTRTVNDPAYRDLKFTLAAGASDEQTIGRVTTVSGGIVPETTVRTTETRRVTYAGRETVTVPAGTFETCRFDFTVAIGTESDTATDWVAVGKGLSVKSVARDTDTATETTLELTSGRINGAPI